MEEGNPVSVIIDSGADATILPSSYLDIGTELDEGAPRLQDAQGVPIAIRGYKQGCFSFKTEHNKEEQIYNKTHFSDGINQLIISYGKLTEAGWNINAGCMNGSQHAMTFGQGPSVVRAPLQLQNRSLIATAHLRAVVEEPQAPMMMRVLEAKLLENLSQKPDIRWAGSRRRTSGLEFTWRRNCRHPNILERFFQRWIGRGQQVAPL